MSWQPSRVVQGRFPAQIQALDDSHKQDGDERARSRNDEGTEQMLLFMKQRHLEKHETPLPEAKAECGNHKQLLTPCQALGVTG